jgi:hypothetical protein
MKLTFRYKGGKGSGHHGHAGRPGKHGGSLPGKGDSSTGGFSVSDANKNYPATMNALSRMAAMNDVGHLIKSALIPGEYAEKFQRVESVFSDARKRKFTTTFKPEEVLWEGEQDVELYDTHSDMSLLEILAGGEVTVQDLVISYYNKKNMPGDLASDLLNDGFQGYLSDILFEY